MSTIPGPNDATYLAVAEQLRRRAVAREKARRTEPVIEVYVCPTEGCGNYYGSSSMGRLEDAVNLGAIGSDYAGQATSRRDRCPTCGAARVRRYARLVPADEVAAARRLANGA